VKCDISTVNDLSRETVPSDVIREFGPNAL
jgi:hypothetical protein